MVCGISIRFKQWFNWWSARLSYKTAYTNAYRPLNAACNCLPIKLINLNAFNHILCHMDDGKQCGQTFLIQAQLYRVKYLQAALSGL